MQINLRSENKEIIHNAMIDSLILIRNLERNSKLHYNYLCIETLLCELKQILSTNVLFNFNKCSTSTDENLESDSLSDKVKILLLKINIIFFFYKKKNNKNKQLIILG